ncbi:hypothetical protein [Burkholderia sp. IMCC1007]|uniref:hypothetical protein n=1 Tax=Burkholderia sp. IMCC1007 TaxID=3004104 RepID=UPI0022B5C832|nr:hypothetical protein [Burkholderia sp. IMCC1007]
MRTALLLSLVPAAIALAAAGMFVPAYADEGVMPDHATLLAVTTLNAPQDRGFDIMFVAVPHRISSDKSSVTLWDEIAPPARQPVPVPAPRPGATQHTMACSAGMPAASMMRTRVRIPDIQ